METVALAGSQHGLKNKSVLINGADECCSKKQVKESISLHNICVVLTITVFTIRRQKSSLSAALRAALRQKSFRSHWQDEIFAFHHILQLLQAGKGLWVLKGFPLVHPNLLCLSWIESLSGLTTVSDDPLLRVQTIFTQMATETKSTTAIVSLTVFAHPTVSGWHIGSLLVSYH